MWSRGRQSQRDLILIIFEWLEAAAEAPIDEGRWHHILFVLRLLPLNDSSYGDVCLGFKIRPEEREYFAVAEQDRESIRFVAQLGCTDLHAALPDDATVVGWHERSGAVTLSTGEVSYQVSIRRSILSASRDLLARARSLRRRSGLRCSVWSSRRAARSNC